MKKRIVSFFLAFILVSGFVASVQADEYADVKVSAIPVAERIYMITGKGGNLGVFTGEDGTFLVDDQFAPLTDKIIEAIESVGGTFPRFVINTHYHGDHTGGNENLGKGGALIYSHDNVRDRLSTGSFLVEFNMKREPVAKDGLPVATFSESISYHINGDLVRALHTPFAHTDGDCFVHFEKNNVIHAGDLFFNGFYPFIDVTHGGSLKGMIDAIDEILALADEKTKIIPGHGPLADKAQLETYRQMLATAYQRLNQLKAEGKTAKEAIEAKPLADLEATWGDGLFTGDRWIEIIYSGI